MESFPGDLFGIGGVLPVLAGEEMKKQIWLLYLSLSLFWLLYLFSLSLLFMIFLFLGGRWMSQKMIMFGGEEEPCGGARILVDLYGFKPSGFVVLVNIYGLL